MATMIEKTIIEIGGDPYKDFNFLNISLSQEFLKPNELRFTMQRKHVSTDKEDVTFSVPKKLIGEKVFLQIITSRFDETASLVNEELMFEGLIFEVDVKRNSMTSEVLVEVVAYSPDYVLMDNKHCTSYTDSTLEDIVNATVKDANYVFIKVKPNFKSPIPYSVQYNESRYEYLVRLAKRYGEYFYYNGVDLFFGADAGSKTKKLYPRTDLLNYKYSAKIKHDNFQHIQTNYMDILPAVDAKNRKGPDDYVQDSDTNDAMVEFANAIKDKSKTVFATPTLQNLDWSRPEENDTDEQEISVKAQFLGAKADQTICSGSTVRADLLLGSKIIIKDIYDKSDDSTNYYEHDELLITKLIHTVEVNGHYKNEFEAISAKCKYPPYTDTDVFRYAGSQQAVVIDNKDPEKLGRIKVIQMWQVGLNFEHLNTPWIRVAQPHGGRDKGFYYIPEIYEMVMVGFEMGNVEKPYITSSLYHNEYHPDEKWVDENNSVKGIRTRNGHTIEIHDEGEDGYIRIYDNEKENYVLTFSTDDQLIRLQSKGNIELDAGWDIILNAGNNIIQKANNNRISEIANTDDVKAGGYNYYSDSVIHMEAKDSFFAEGKSKAIIGSDGKTQIQGPTVNAFATGTLKAHSGGPASLKGKGTVTVETDGIATIKGAMVNIN
jgi:Uncharacterized protein conserved in bacteria